MKRTKETPRRKPKPGERWRLATTGKGAIAPANLGEFDELVVDEWFHLERMDTSAWWMRVGALDLWIRVRTDGKADVTIRFVEPGLGDVRGVEHLRAVPGLGDDQ